MTDPLAIPSDWLDAEIANVEAKLAENPPMCALDRQGAAPAGLKELEGRYALLRRARRVIETGGVLADLAHEVQKADMIARASRSASPQWIGYARGVASAFEEIRSRLQTPASDEPGEDRTPSESASDATRGSP